MLRAVVFALAIAFAYGQSVHAQNPVLAEFYGRGVHAYYSGDLVNAYDYLSKSIDGGIKDPRAFYFRGLTAVASGREYEAEADYRAGAELEAKGNFGASIGQSLARIQGSHRLAIENMRQQARLEYQATAAARSRARYGELGVNPQPPRRAVPVPATPPAAVAPVVPPATENPFADDAAAAPTVDAPDALPSADVDPFADDAPAPAGDAAPAAPSDDPFGGSAPAAPADDPFGGAAEPAAPAADPFADPFG